MAFGDSRSLPAYLMSEWPTRVHHALVTPATRWRVVIEDVTDVDHDVFLNTVLRIRDLIRDALPGSLTQDEAADRLHMSPRTLHRRLEEEGSSFRGIKEALRRDIALARLTKTRQPIAQVAADLGYADTSAFYRAFTGWTGLSPERYRKQLANSAAQSSAGNP